MIRYITNKEIDKHKWDGCISKSFNGIIYAYSWYLDIVCPLWDALVENDYERVFPLTSRKKAGIKYLYQPFFTQQSGVFSKTRLSEDIIEIFINSIPPKYKLVEINLNTFNKPDAQKHQLTSNLTHELDLISTYETIFSKYSDNIKRNIKQALNSDVKITKNANLSEITEIFRLNKGKDLKTFRDRDYQTLKEIVEVCLSKSKAHVWGVINKTGKLCAGAVFVESNGKVIFLFSATNAEAKSVGAMSFLIDAFIKENSQRNLILDFEGSNDPNLARFYKGFGAKECTYFQYRRNNIPWSMAKVINLIKLIK